MLKLNELAKELHANSISHGWWEGDRSEDEIIALIHSEWSEALEEYRAGRLMVWYEHGSEGCALCEDKPERYCYCVGDEKGSCQGSLKPEGIAVELIDGCIRILDLFGKYEYQSISATFIELERRSRDTFKNLHKGTPAPTVIAMLHQMTSSAHQLAQMRGGFTQTAFAPLEAAIGMACAWIRMQGCDPEAILREKHSYNRTRPYKHGGKKC